MNKKLMSLDESKIIKRGQSLSNWRLICQGGGEIARPAPAALPLKQQASCLDWSSDIFNLTYSVQR